jgi:subtilisin family serine protease
LHKAHRSFCGAFVVANLEKYISKFHLLLALAFSLIFSPFALAALPKSSPTIHHARKLSQGSRSVIVAVIDTGIDARHPSLRGKLWRKPGQKNLEFGWDFVLNQPNPKDSNGHGTHIAGIIGAEPSEKVRIMALRFYSEDSSDEEVIENTAKAVDYAIANGADIINYSAGGSTFSLSEKSAFARAEAKGILVIAAAGNKGKNADIEKQKFYPASYGFENMISVAALGAEGELISSSNWGPKSVHIAAPGENIRSTLPEGKFGYLTGTSQSAAFVTNVAALMLAKDPSLRGRPLSTKAMILEHVDRLALLEDKISTGGRLNALAVIRSLNPNRIPAAGLARRK